MKLPMIHLMLCSLVAGRPALAQTVPPPAPAQPIVGQATLVPADLKDPFLLEALQAAGAQHPRWFIAKIDRATKRQQALGPNYQDFRIFGEIRDVPNNKTFGSLHFVKTPGPTWTLELERPVRYEGNGR
jgi:hypothetical protein